MAYLMGLIVTGMFASQRASTTWLQHESVQQLFDVQQMDGVGIITKHRTVEVVNKDRKIVFRAKLNEGESPIAYSPKRGLLTSQIPSWSEPDGVKTATPVRFYAGQCGSLIAFGVKAHVFLDHGDFVTPKSFGPWSGLAVSDDLSTCVVFDRPGETLQMRVFRFGNGGWTDEDRTIVPMIMGEGRPVIIPRFNDVRFVSPRYVLMVGAIAQDIKQEPEASAAYSRALGLLPLYTFGKESRVGSAVLATVDVETGETVAIGRVDVDGGRELGGPMLGRMSVSGGYSAVYLQVADGIARLTANSFPTQDQGRRTSSRWHTFPEASCR